MLESYFSFFHWVDNTKFYGVPIDFVLHFSVSFTLFWLFRRLIGFRVGWSILFILLLGLGKEWTDRSAVYNSGKFEEPYKDMAVNCLGILMGAIFFWSKREGKAKSKILK